VDDQPLAQGLVARGLEVLPELAQARVALGLGRDLLVLGGREVDGVERRDVDDVVGAELGRVGLELGVGGSLVLDAREVVDSVVLDLEGVVDSLRPGGAPAHTLTSTVRR